MANSKNLNALNTLNTIIVKKNEKLSSLVFLVFRFTFPCSVFYRLVTCKARSASASFSRMSSPSQSNIGNEVCSPSWKRV